MKKIEKIYPETLLQLMLDVLKYSPKFSYIRGIQPFFMSFDSKEYYVYVKNLSSAYFKERPDTTRAQLPIREDFEEIKASPNPFIFLGYDQDNDVLVCWNYNVAKTRLNEKKSVSFYSRQFFQEEVSLGDFLRKRLKNGDEPILFKRKNLIEFFSQIDTFFVADEGNDEQSGLFNVENVESKNEQLEKVTNPYASDGKLLKITDKALVSQLKSIVQTNHMLEAMKLVERFYKGQFPAMKLKDWHNLIREIDFNMPETITVSVEQSGIDIAEQHKIQFIEFMHSQNKSESIIGRYVNAITGIVTSLVKEYYAPEINSIFNTVEVSLLHSWADQLLIRPDFIKLNTIRHRDYSCALNKYIEFAESLGTKISANIHIAAEPALPYIIPKTCESLFMQFMQDAGLSEHSSKYYIQALSGRISDCIRKYLMPELQNIFSIVDTQLLLSWSQYLHRNKEFKEINTTGNRQYSCALSKYIQFTETLASGNTDGEKTGYSKAPGKVEKRKSHVLRVTCPDGRVIEERMVYKTLIEVIQCAGALKVQSLGIFLNGVNLVSETVMPRYKVSQKPIENGLYVTTCSDISTKQRIIEQISEAFNMGLIVEKVSIV
jgi:hypothetical protein